MIKTKHIDASREIRLWITQVFIPTGVGIYIFVNTETGQKCIRKTKEKFKKIKDKHAK